MSTAGDAIKFATGKSARLAANARGDWRKIAAYGAAAAVVFVAAAFGYASLSRLRKEKSETEGEEAGEKPEK